MDTLQDLVTEEKILLDKISENRTKQRSINAELFCTEYGINIGDTIEFMDWNKKVIGVFDHIDFSGVRVNYPVVKAFNAAGKVGKRQAHPRYAQKETIKLVTKS